ncbi:hypothetical protein EN866_34240, partial [Mesorhizobium sp. M2D.F.Ca.ET.223.01.1.1]|uniref:hypothetical protein n=1 Tax=Mesorhizobium sp. M2D.F.Ca.ET.223.01.1.1 TaxID=2563940 RepID=UPI0010933686
MSLMNFAKEELTRAGFFDKDAMYGGMLGDAVMKMIEVFMGEGHSGMSAPIAISAFEKVARFQPLTPLTGEDDEWMEIDGPSEGNPERAVCYQNKRCPHVFKDADGPYDIEGRIFREPSGACFTSRDSRVRISFPYVPHHEYVDVP